ncbi:MAG: hypothetical protein ABSB58_07485 [Gemmatimonadales bacterium]
MMPLPEFRSLRAIGREIGVPERVLLADAARFAAFVPCRTVDGKRRYGPAAAAALHLVARLRAAGADEASIAVELGRGPVALVPPTPPIAVSLDDLATALNRRRERRRRVLLAMREALRGLGEAADRHQRKVAELRGAVEAHGADLSKLRYYDTMMARFRAELRSAERTMAEAFRTAAGGAAPVRGAR